MLDTGAETSTRRFIGPSHRIKRAAWRILLPGVFLTVFVLQAAESMTHKTPTFDEQFHLYSGYGYLIRQNYTVGLAQPPLARIWAAVPFLFAKENLPPQLWQPPAPFQSRNSIWWQYQAAQSFYYRLAHPARSLFLSRLMMVLLGGGLALLVYRWAGDLYGPRAALIPLLFCTFDPNLLAHARLVNTDVAATLGIFASVYLLWLHHSERSRAYVFLSGIAAGLAILSKYSSLVVGPILVLLVIYHVAAMRDEGFFKASAVLKHALPELGLLGCGIIIGCWLCYLPALGVSAQRPDFAEFAAAAGLSDSGFPRFLYFLYRFSPVHPYFLRGLLYVMDQQRAPQPAFLMGNFSARGWWQYFPVAFVLKTPIAFMAAVCLSLILLMTEKRQAWPRGDVLFLLLPPVVIFGAATMSDVNIGLRHILPLYPFLFAFAGHMATMEIRKPLKKLVISLLCLWLVFSSLRVYPHYLAYFNEIIGGPDGGHRYLIDSNLDWGQDLDNLREYMDRRGIAWVWLKYFGMALPEKHGVRYRPLPCSPVSGVVAISATFLQQNPDGCYGWLQKLQPTDNIGHSILIHDVPPTEDASQP